MPLTNALSKLSANAQTSTGGHILSSLTDWMASLLTGKAKFRQIYQISLDLLKETILDITPYATPQKFRFLDCSGIVDNRILRIFEFDGSLSDLPWVYSAISYVWRGNPTDPTTLLNYGAIHVDCGGRDEGDPISIEVLTHASVASIQNGAMYLWLDRLCIMQTNRADKGWQISHMYEIYKACKVTIVLPGGLQRLVTLAEETSWIDRAWTFQEAVVPESVLVLFTYENNQTTDDIFRLIGRGEYATVVRPNQSILAPVAQLAAHHYDRRNPRVYKSEDKNVVKIFGTDHRKANSLARVLRSKMSTSKPWVSINPVNAYPDIWKSTQMRTSSRPVDVVFSVMGLVGVHLDTLGFSDNERFMATIALAQEMLRKDTRGPNSQQHVPLWKQPYRLPSSSPKDRDGALGMVTLQELAEVMDSQHSEPSDCSERYLGCVDNQDGEGHQVKTAGEISPQIPHDLMLQVYTCNNPQRTFATVAGGIIIELCRELYQPRAVKDDSSPICAVIYGWTITSHVSLMREEDRTLYFDTKGWDFDAPPPRPLPGDIYGGADSFPIVTFYKFDLSHCFPAKH